LEQNSKLEKESEEEKRIRKTGKKRTPIVPFLQMGVGKRNPWKGRRGYLGKGETV